MTIEREILPGVKLTIQLTAEEILAVYREKEADYLVEDARRHITDYCESRDLPDQSGNKELVSACILEFQNRHDCNNDENSIWENAVEKCMAEYVSFCYIVGRPANGITINPREYIMEDDGREKRFESVEQARSFLRANGYTDEEMEGLSFIAVEGTCAE